MVEIPPNLESLDFHDLLGHSSLLETGIPALVGHSVLLQENSSLKVSPARTQKSVWDFKADFQGMQPNFRSI